MEILRKGTVRPNDRSAIFTCRECGSKIKGKMSEGRYVADWKDGDYVEMKCPQCKEVNAVAATLFVL